jgi:hypothetical protein
VTTTPDRLTPAEQESLALDLERAAAAVRARAPRRAHVESHETIPEPTREEQYAGKLESAMHSHVRTFQIEW